MSTVSVSKIVSTAKSLIGKDSGTGCDIMKWYGGFSTAVNSVACCCAGMMYLFNKAGALSMIPGGKTASCGTLAVNFYNAGQLKSASDVQVGDLVIFSWSKQKTTYTSALQKFGCLTLDHVELCIAVGSSTITTIGANNGGTECDDFRQKTRYKSNISCCCRPKYSGSSSSSTSTTTTTTTTSSGSTSIKTVQKWVGTTQDGIYGSNTKKALVKKLQTELNSQFKVGLTVDGVWGSKTKAAVSTYATLRQGASGNITKTLQGLLICNGYSTNGFDGVYGSGTTAAVKKYQSTKGLTADGIAGANTFAKLCG